MQNNYKIIDYSEVGIPFVEVCGDVFSYQDLYELVGSQKFMTTFNFKENTEAQTQYGESVTGVIYYDHKTLSKLSELSSGNGYTDLEVLKIISPTQDLSVEKRNDLKYGGISVSDIKSISFLPYQREVETYGTGEKKVPDIIEIEVDCEGIDPDVLCQNYLISKINGQVELIDYEKEQLIGIMLALGNGRIDSRVLSHFDFNKDSVKDNMNVRYHWYIVKKRRNILSEKEGQTLSNIESIMKTGNVIKFMQEMNASGVKQQELKENANVLKEVMDSIMSFPPSILLHGKRQIYWDVDSYIHIVMRHIKGYQLGSFKDKTPLPYKVEDLKMLIEKVLKCIGGEYQLHFSDNPDSNFSRNGSMAVVFNGDHYHLKINPNGRLAQFHTVGVNLN